MDERDEWQAIQRSRRGSAAAFEGLVRQYERPALALAYGLLGDSDDAADAVQDAFVRAYRSLGRLEDGSAFGPWFRAIVRNLCLDRLRSPRRRRRTSWSPDVTDRADWSEPVGTRRLEREQLASAVRAALAALSDEHRLVLTLKELDGRSYAEIARILDVPEGTVASRLYHARKALKKVLLARGISLEAVGP